VSFAVGGRPPSCFFNKRNRAGLFLNNRFTCVAECLERMLVTMLLDDDDDVIVMAKTLAWPTRPMMAGVSLAAADLTTPKKDIIIFCCF